MPLDDDYSDLPPETPKVKSGLKQVSTQKSIFEGAAKKPSQEDLDKRVRGMQEQDFSFKKRTAELAIQFRKLMDDKTLPQNKSIFAAEMEKEVLSSIIQLAAEINDHPDEGEGMGSLSWIAQLFKTCLGQRDRMNRMEYALFQLEKKIEAAPSREFVSKEIFKALDSKKISE